jgi:hypothetical protein
MGHPVTITGAVISLGSARGAALQIRVGAAHGLAERLPADPVGTFQASVYNIKLTGA